MFNSSPQVAWASSVLWYASCHEKEGSGDAHYAHVEPRLCLHRGVLPHSRNSHVSYDPWRKPRCFLWCSGLFPLWPQTTSYSLPFVYSTPLDPKPPEWLLVGFLTNTYLFILEHHSLYVFKRKKVTTFQSLWIENEVIYENNAYFLNSNWHKLSSLDFIVYFLICWPLF